MDRNNLTRKKDGSKYRVKMKKIWRVLIYCLVIVVLPLSYLYGFQTDYIYLANDLAWPRSCSQALAWYEASSSAWTTLVLGGDVNLPAGLDSWLVYLASLSVCHFGAGVSQYLFLGAILILCAVAGFLIGRTFGLSNNWALLSSAYFTSSPFIYNFILMGWLYAILSVAALGILLWTTLKASEKSSLARSALVVLVSVVVGLQSNAIAWMPIAFGILAFCNPKDIRHAKGFYVIIFCSLVAFGLLYIFQVTQLVANNFSLHDEVRKSPATLAMYSGISLHQMILGYGSTFNRDFESSLESIISVGILLPVLWSFTTIVVTFLIGLSLLSKNICIRRLSYCLFLLMLILLVSKETLFIQEIPIFGSILRDPARNIALLSLFIPILIADSARSVWLWLISVAYKQKGLGDANNEN